jgi:hypothetical protein
MSTFFKNFPVVDYAFGDDEESVQFQNLGVYIDLIDQVADEKTFYDFYNVQEGERPDIVSHLLYDSPNYGWTFFLLNEKLRTKGWPVSTLRVYDLADKFYPNIVVETTDNIGASEYITEGATVQGASSDQTGVVLQVNYDLGQIVIDKASVFPNQDAFIYDVTKTPAQAVRISGQSKQIYANHHYELNGEIVDYYDSHSSDELTINWKDKSGLTEVTYLDRLLALNEDQKQIKVFKQDVIIQILDEFTRLLR